MPGTYRDTRPAVAAAGATDPGRVRTHNEDRLLVDVDRGIFAVVDGVGGHAAGEVAASIAVDVMARRLERPLWSPEQRVREAIVLANNEILTQAQASPQYAGMTCVLTLALLTERGLTVGHVGDTRLYKLTPERMIKLTHDHSPVGEREDAGEITEAEAMRHPRRNEVFRDVGSLFHEPQDRDFVDVIETPFDERTAVLLCSDGLSDMLPAAAIERIVRQHAGEPPRVVEALIQAANEAGGRDNVTAVYVEGTSFARATAAVAAGAAAASARPEPPAPAGWASRATWLSAGLVAGLTLGLALAWMLERYAPLPAGAGGRTLLVAPAGTGEPSRLAFDTITAALAAATAGDIVQVEPGEYAEEVVLPPGVDLVARQPGTVWLVAMPGREAWTALAADGAPFGNRISGIGIRGRPEARVTTGLRLTGHGIDVSDVQVTGDVGIGVEVATDGDVTLRGSHLANAGLPLRLGHGARPRLRQNHFVFAGTRDVPAVEMAPDAWPELEHNTFAGYARVIAGAHDRRLLDGNFVVGRGGPQPAQEQP